MDTLAYVVAAIWSAAFAFAAGYLLGERRGGRP